MAAKYTVSLAKILKDLQFDVLYMPKDPSDILISSLDVHRPGLIIAGFDDFFDSARINFLGKAEVEYINRFHKDERYEKVEKYTFPDCRGGWVHTLCFYRFHSFHK